MSAPVERRRALDVAADAMQAWIDRRQRGLVSKLHSCGQSLTQLHMLGVLQEGGPMTVGQLAAQLGISAASASAAVERMVEAQLVLRERGHEDRRVVTVSLATAGDAALERATGGRREALERVLEQLSDDELRDLVRLIGRLEDAIATAVVAGALPAPPCAVGHDQDDMLPARAAGMEEAVT